MGLDEACEECHSKIVAMSRLVPEYSRYDAMAYLATRVPIITFSLAALSIVLRWLTGPVIIGRVPTVTFVGVLAMLSGLQMIWVRSEGRYGATHSLAWSLNSKPVVRGLAVLLSGVFVGVLAAFL